MGYYKDSWDVVKVTLFPLWFKDEKEAVINEFQNSKNYDSNTKEKVMKVLKWSDYLYIYETPFAIIAIIIVLFFPIDYLGLPINNETFLIVGFSWIIYIPLISYLLVSRLLRREFSQ